MPRMPDDMAARYGEILDQFEASIETLNSSKSDTLSDLRADLKQLGMTGAEISAEVAMLKGAVKLQRMTEAERLKADAKDDGVADYMNVLALVRTRARAHAENIEEFGNSRVNSSLPEHDADGVIIEPQAAMPAQTGAVSMPPIGAPELASVESSASSQISGAVVLSGGADPAASSAGMEGEVDRRPHPEPVPAADLPAATVADARSAGIPPAAAPGAPDRTKPHPWCADPEECGVEASWNHMCRSCLRRHDQQVAAEAVQ